MEFSVHDDLDCMKIAQSGQCFRWYPLSNSQYRVFAGNHTAILEQPTAHRLIIHDAQPDEQAFWHHYLDLSMQYANIRAQIDREDAYLQAAVTYGEGIRILRQQPFEMLITFLLSQRKSIPAIRTAVEALCRTAGQCIGQENGQPLYAFPTPEALASLSDDQLAACGLGYRLPYIRAAAHTVARDPDAFYNLNQQSDDQLLDALLAFHGVGHKIAHCVMLFGFHRLNAFPRDVWINRVLDTHYSNGYPFTRYTPFNGIIQQYLFFYSRQNR